MYVCSGKKVKPYGEEAVYALMCVPAPFQCSPMILNRALAWDSN